MGVWRMYQIGDQVLYGIHGVCRVVELEKRTVDRKSLTYLVLEPDGQQSARYFVPTHNEAAMSKLRRVLTAGELEELLNSPEIREDRWIRDENQRKNAYRELISSGDRAALMGMVCTLYRHKAAQTAAGRRCHLCDENFLRDAEKLLSSEAALVMGMEYEQARNYLRQQLKSE